MCCACWQEDGAPQIDNERVRGIQPLIREVYDHHCAGGNLHIALDDNNLEDYNLDFCEERIKEGDSHHDFEDSPEQAAAERACLAALRAMTYEERVSAMGLWDGCWSPKP